MLFSNQVLKYHFNLNPDISLPAGVEWLFPYSMPETQRCMTSFYSRFYHDRHPRIFILGINPGRFGGGLTGVPFTDPIRLEKLGIANSFPKKPELSSVFVYEMIDACGGPEDFYSRFYITSLSPLGLIKDGVNYNYYDDAQLARIIEPFIIQNINIQIGFGYNPSIAFCLGQGKNFTYLDKLNRTHQWWERILPLPHPRWIMQYRLKEKSAFIDAYRKDLLVY